jgi:hypothetical protein
VRDSDVIVLPDFLAAPGGVSQDRETDCRAAYREGLSETDPTRRARRLAFAAAACPAVGEPCVWLADATAVSGDAATGRAWASVAADRLDKLGVAWDKRLSFRRWMELAEALGAAPSSDHAGPLTTDPRDLYAQLIGDEHRATPRPRPRTAPATGRERFTRYMAAIADAPSSGGRIVYPDLPSRPWFAPSAIPLARALERHAAEVTAEVQALSASRFTRESEAIPRTGDWDVIFLYERGRRHDEVCAACPQTTRLIESSDAMLTADGLVYVSRMRPHTHIAAHRGPTNLRLRCHLGIAVPDGDCAIRVGTETRRWQRARCLVFDDHFEHEAWNHTEQERVVLIVDIWHPGLSDDETHLLAGLHHYSSQYASRLARYWRINEAARAGRAHPAADAGSLPDEPDQKKSPPPPKPSPPSPPSPKPSPPSPPSPSPPSPPSPHPSPPSPNMPPTSSSPSPRPAPSADPMSSVESSDPPPKPVK